MLVIKFFNDNFFFIVISFVHVIIFLSHFHPDLTGSLLILLKHIILLNEPQVADGDLLEATEPPHLCDNGQLVGWKSLGTNPGDKRQ